MYTLPAKITIRISVLCDITKICKKSPILTTSRQYILHNNNAGKLLTNCKKKIPINNQGDLSYFTFQMNLLIS